MKLPGCWPHGDRGTWCSTPCTAPLPPGQGAMGCDVFRQAQVTGPGLPTSNGESEQEQLQNNRTTCSARYTQPGKHISSYVSPRGNRQLRCAAAALQQAGCCPPQRSKAPGRGAWSCSHPGCSVFSHLWLRPQNLGARPQRGQIPVPLAPGAARWLLTPRGARTHLPTRLGQGRAMLTMRSGPGCSLGWAA